MSCLFQNTAWRLFPLWITCSGKTAADALNLFAIEKSKKRPLFNNVVLLNLN